MTNIILLGLMTLACASLGYLAANRLKQRETALQGLADGFKTLAMHMEYADLPLKEAFDKAAASANEYVKAFFTKIAQEMDENGLTQSFDAALRGLPCTDGDREALSSFARNLGNTDRASQRKNFELLQGGLSVRLAEARKETRDKGKIYRSLGVLAGLALAVALI